MKLLLHVFVLFSGFIWFAAARAQQWNSLDNGGTSPAISTPLDTEGSSDANQIVQRALNKRCAHSYSTACLKLDLVSLVERLSSQQSYQLLPSISMVRHESDDQSDSEARSSQSSHESSDSVMAAMAQDGPEAAETRLDGLLLDRVSRYLDTHAISVRLFDDDSLAKMRKVGQEVADKYGFLSAQSGRGKDKGGKGGALLMGLMMMKATLGALGFGAIAALAGKALMVGMLSMMLSAIVGLKSLASGGGGKAVTYEIISKPVYSHAHSHSHEHSDHGGGYGGGSYGHGRSFSDEQAAHQMAYQGQRK